VLRHYQAKGHIEFHSFELPFEPEVEVRDAEALVAMNDCMYR
jgi:hypothetical protein